MVSCDLTREYDQNHPHAGRDAVPHLSQRAASAVVGHLIEAIRVIFHGKQTRTRPGKRLQKSDGKITIFNR